MGLEARCRARHGKQAGEGKALLETDSLIFRGAFKLDIPFKDIKTARVKDGALTLTFSQGTATFLLGTAAEKWLGKIQKPRGLMDKLGVKAEHRVSLIGVIDEAFRNELRARVAELCEGKVARDSDLVFFGVDNAEELERLGVIKKALRANGALWIVRKKGSAATVSEGAVLSAGRAAGLVDVKVVAFSGTHTAEKLVIPIDQR
jgi:hypothetical protein